MARPVECKHCHLSGFSWQTLDGRWQLVDSYGEVHKCQVQHEPTIQVSPQVYNGQWQKMVEDASELAVKAVVTSTTVAAEFAGLGQRVDRHMGEIHDLVNDWNERINRARVVEISVNGHAPVVTGHQHVELPRLLKMVAAGVNTFMRGPAGSGKTSAAAEVARLMHLPFYPMSVGPQTSKSDLLGFMTGNGTYVTSPFRRAFEGGGLALGDELDAGNAGVVTIINSLLANPLVSFPDGTVERHKDFHFIAAGNTYGRGADSMYVGRAQLDAATLDRFSFLNWDYDWDFTEVLSGDSEWTWNVRELSESAAWAKLKVVIGPRAAIDGAKLLRAGFSWEEVEDLRIWNGIGVDHKATILRGVGR